MRCFAFYYLKTYCLSAFMMGNYVYVCVCVFVCVSCRRLYGQDRAMVSDVAGTTRDTVDALLRRVSKPKIPRKKSGDKMRSMSTNPTPASSSSSGSGSAGSSNRVSCDSDQVAKRLDTDSSSSSSNSSMDLSSASTNSSGVTSVYRFIDTAGIRKRGKVSYGPEFFMVNR